MNANEDGIVFANKDVIKDYIPTKRELGYIHNVCVYCPKQKDHCKNVFMKKNHNMLHPFTGQ